MKSLLSLVLLLSTTGFAAELHLSAGETATIFANTRTTVTCNGGTSGNQCQEKINGLRTLVEACENNYTPATCMDKYWPSFKQQNPSCVSSALSYCIDRCSENYTPATCADRCNR